jgi:hypothetical protein
MDVWTSDTVGTAGMILLSCAANNAHPCLWVVRGGGSLADGCGDRVPRML